MKEERINNIPRFIVLDIVFEGQSLNYDQGVGAYQELKKIHRGDGRVYTLVSRYALRYSILEQGKSIYEWKLADRDVLIRVGEDSKVIQPDPKKLKDILEYDDLNFFGFLITEAFKIEKEKKEKEEEGISVSFARPAPVRLTHAISMEPFKFDSHFNVNIGLARRYDPDGSYQSPFQMEEHRSYYKYSVVINVNQLLEGIRHHVRNEEILKKYKEELKLEAKDNWIVIPPKDAEKIKERIYQLITVIFNLKRSIKAREEDLSPILAIVGCYTNIYTSFLNDLQLVPYTSRVTEVEEKEEDGKKKMIIKEKELTDVCFDFRNIEEVSKNKDNVKIYVRNPNLLDSRIREQFRVITEKWGGKIIVTEKEEILQWIRDKLGIPKKI